MSEDEFKRDREVIEAATEGPWENRDLGGNRLIYPPKGSINDNYLETTVVSLMLPPEDWTGDAMRQFHEHSEPNATFIARARTRWPAALDEIERLRAGYARMYRHSESHHERAIKAEDERDQLNSHIDALASEHEMLMGAYEELQAENERLREAAKQAVEDVEDFNLGDVVMHLRAVLND